MSSGIEKLNALVPLGLTPSSTKQDIINFTYKDNLGEKLVIFLQEINLNIVRKYEGKIMTVPKVNWKTTSSVSLNFYDNILMYGTLTNSLFLKIVNTYLKNVQDHRMYLYMRSQGKVAKQALRPNNL